MRNLHNLSLIAAASAALSLGIGSQIAVEAATFSIFSTGEETEATAAGFVDAYWTVDGGDAFAIEENLLWAVPTGSGSWIGPSPTSSSSAPSGEYKYSTTFDLTGYDPSTASLEGKFLADNSTSRVYLNGQELTFDVENGSDMAPFTIPTSFEITSGFQDGLNLLEFVVANTMNFDSPTGLYVGFSTAEADFADDDSDTRDIPESSSVVVLGVLGTGLLVTRKKFSGS